MKLFKNVLTALAFAFAVTAAFAFTAPKNAETGTISVKAKGICTQPHQVSDQCTSTQTGQLCKIQIGLDQYEVVPLDFPCDSQSLRNPNL